ncbi:hypothetical protein LOZ56_006890, partial [Ophidiomyces ophidiicola]
MPGRTPGAARPDQAEQAQHAAAGADDAVSASGSGSGSGGGCGERAASVSTSQRMVSATAGSILTSLL